MGTKGMRRRAPHPLDVARDRIWKSMRHLRRFTRADLMATAEAGRDNVNRYIAALVEAEYVKVVQPKQQGIVGGDEVLMLTRNTGPVAPRASNDGLYDANLADPYQVSPGKRLMKHAPAIMHALREVLDVRGNRDGGLRLSIALDKAAAVLAAHDGPQS